VLLNIPDISTNSYYVKQLLSFLPKKSKKYYFLILFIGVLNSTINTLFMIIVSNSLTKSTLYSFSKNGVFLFGTIFVCSFLLNYLFHSQIIKITVKIVFNTEIGLIKAVKDSSLYNFSRTGNEQVYSNLQGIKTLSEAPIILINAFTALLTVIACVLYLFHIYFQFGLFVVFLLFILWWAHHFRNKIALHNHKKITELNAEHYKYVNDLLLGFKYFKISAKKNINLLDKFVIQNRLSNNKFEVANREKYLLNSMISNYVWYFILGIVIFLFPLLKNVRIEYLPVFVILIIYIIGPIGTLIAFMSFYDSVKVFMERFSGMRESLSGSSEKETLYHYNSKLPEFSFIKFVDIVFEHVDQKKNVSFTLGPMNLCIAKSEIVFIIGGNGSGKSTFLNLLVGLYSPLFGKILYNNTPINEESYVEYRDKFSVVFGEGYLLNENYGEHLFESNAEFDNYIRLMKLEHVLNVQKPFGNKDSLSKGQQKRLAFILALCEGKEIIVLDEWAAEQDTVFKEHFYQFVLPYLKANGKTIIAITHDDEYLGMADKVIKLRDGNIV
jgi:ABC-type siderophore export system fused ATPase/permease subunit